MKKIGRLYVKLFWIPFRIGEGDSSITLNESIDDISEETDSPIIEL
jgi:hypothetical protein